MKEVKYTRPAKDVEHKICREYLKGKPCEMCEQIFQDLINHTGFYNKIQNPPELLTDEDIEEYGSGEEAYKALYDEFVRPAEGFARCHALCREHQKVLRNDNQERNELGMDIPTDFSLLRYKKSLI